MFWRIIRRKVIRLKRRKVRKPTKEYKLHKERARALMHYRLQFFNTHYNFRIGKVAIRDQKSRWGSCSKKGNLNFNYRIVLLPEHLADYVIVHELCHIAEFNHSKNFFALVAQTVPDWRKRRTELKKIRFKYTLSEGLSFVNSVMRLGFLGL